ncbi:putative Small GTPase superfamily [Paratrimastix pyriformis]|uniref:Small GTPase superfamily n=1 Tax=Paratrimastix pyriformis TaxID=342808 RepID=A0ABQ8UP55_9EUKA|nr:putative Small GTPase superfamily [Paratrimastix pyriformis]
MAPLLLPPTPLDLPELLVQILARVEIRTFYSCLAVSRLWHETALLPVCWKLRCLAEGVWHEDEPVPKTEPNPWIALYFSANGTHTLKVVLVNGLSSGKTALCQRLMTGQFIESGSTIGAAFMRKTLTVPPCASATLEIWDTAGQERYRRLAPMYYRGAAAVLVCYDCTDASVFQEAKSWVDEVRQSADPAIGLVCCKCDLVDRRQVTRAQGEAFAASVKATYWETSALTGQGVQECFVGIARAAIVSHRSRKDEPFRPTPPEPGPLPPPRPRCIIA